MGDLLSRELIRDTCLITCNTPSAGLVALASASYRTHISSTLRTIHKRRSSGDPCLLMVLASVCLVETMTQRDNLQFAHTKKRHTERNHIGKTSTRYVIVSALDHTLRVLGTGSWLLPSNANIGWRVFYIRFKYVQ